MKILYSDTVATFYHVIHIHGSGRCITTHNTHSSINADVRQYDVLSLYNTNPPLLPRHYVLLYQGHIVPKCYNIELYVAQGYTVLRVTEYTFGSQGCTFEHHVCLHSYSRYNLKKTAVVCRRLYTCMNIF